MATKIESLRIATRTTSDKRRSGARFAVALRNWARNGQLGLSDSVEMRRYTGAR